MLRRTRLTALALGILAVGCSDSPQEPDSDPRFEVRVTTDKSTYTVGEAILVQLENRSTHAVFVDTHVCPPRVERFEYDDENQESSWTVQYLCNCACPAIAEPPVRVEPGATIEHGISGKASLEFLGPGKYRDSFRVWAQLAGQPGSYFAEFMIESP